jgi:hypothetical protein
MCGRWEDVMVSRGGSESGDARGLRDEAEAALTRLVRLNPPGRVSLAGAYALGYAALGMAQLDRDGPDWFNELDPLDAPFLGAAVPRRFQDRYQFANARTAWLRVLRGTAQWKGIERFVAEAVAASEQHGMPVDEGDLRLLLVGRVEAAGLDQREIPRALLPATALADSRVATGPRPDVVLPEPPRNADMRVARMWAATHVDMPHDGSAADALREGLHLLGNAGVDVPGEPAALLPALYAALVARDDEEVQEVADRAMA